MKVLFVMIALTSSAFIADAQKQSSDRIYWLALDKYTIALDSNYHPSSSTFKEKKIYLQKPDCVDSLPSEINGYDIIQIKGESQKKLYKKHKNVLVHTIMFPVAVEDSLLYITITPYAGRLKGSRHYFLAVSEGTTVYFKYDNKTKQFVVFKVKNWGI